MNKQLHSLSRGAAIVEFAIVLPVLLILLFGITELGRALYQQNTLYKAVQNGARYLARVNGVISVEGDSSSVPPILPCGANDTAIWGSYVDKAKNLVAYGSGSSPLLPNLEPDIVMIGLTAKTLTQADGTEEPLCIVSVSAEVPFAGIFGDTLIPFSGIGAINLHAETEERFIGL